MNNKTILFLFFFGSATGIFALFLIAPIATVMVCTVFILMIVLRRCIQ